MRTALGVAVLTVCLGLTGCSLFGKKQAAHTPSPKAFMGSDSTPKRDTPIVSTTPGGPLPRANGLLAGQVIDSFTGKPVKGARIEIKDLEEETTKAAELDAETVEGGYFTIQGLTPGRHYKLIARANEGKELASGIAIVAPPRSTILIQIDKRLTTPSTPGIPDPPKTPGKKNTPGTESGQERSPAASLAPPIKLAPGAEPPSESEPSPPGGGTGASRENKNPPNITNIAEEFAHAPKDPTVDIHGPGREQYRTAPRVPPPPSMEWRGMQDERRPSSEPPPISPRQPGSVQLPNRETRVPSCRLFGNKLDNFALADLAGKTWEYRRDRKGRLVLLDFWFSTCPACKHAIAYLNDLQARYGRYKLEVVGIACESDTEEKAEQYVRNVRARYYMNYMTLLCGGGRDRCPVVNQFRIEHYPTLILLDESGTIIWRSPDEGMYDEAWKALEALIARRLVQNVRTP